MRKQMVGIALILFGILLTIPNRIFDLWIPIIDTIPWGLFGFILGVLGLIYVIMNAKETKAKPEADESKGLGEQ